MTGFRWFSKVICVLALRAKVASALEGLKYSIKASQASLKYKHNLV